jgi:hypothetical protein
MIILHWDLRYDRYYCCRLFGTLGENILPFIGNACFIPIVAILMDVFKCTESVGDEFEDAYLDRDCHEWCWQDNHIYYASAAAVCLVFYFPLAIFVRPEW